MCPDANFCEHYFDKLLEKFHPIVHAEGRGGKVQCKHGDGECTGNKYQLCVGRHTPPERNRDWFLRFLVCTWETRTMVYSRSIVSECLNKVDADKKVSSAVDACLEGSEGDGLMLQDARLVAKRGMQRSCTVAIEGTKRCIRDGGRWYDCPGGDKEEDFVRSLCDAYRAKTGKDSPLCPHAAHVSTSRKE
ncbi:hypothetical protein MNEG_3608 [Monoraphidium neglectum]|uniref:Uncharacterized protein n=1 Tax=Monoraphidium neglectum TaxID=145388 RepID=A0A0D2K150_9CHLO|nr:hypothetical protein MNEG_3608 [Monoraphidium neglectum]KIZ04353.1 hypothetical protein MNEG_3608 [Monoraphidium neglectum]|eukprot:XP_013903372.1 hypothetical protein MNEG_3608 [Monoraphidium neglectum]